MDTSDFDYHLPEELIAQRPPERRGESRMMVIDRASGEIDHLRFADFPELVDREDLVVLNDTRVVPARFFCNDGSREILRTEVISETRWKCLVRPGKRFKVGRTVEIGDSVGAVVEILPEGGERIIEFDVAPDEEKHGHLALPPYIDRPDEGEDRERYQTVYANESGSIAAPTAGLHFDGATLRELPHAFVTLHVGVGTFRPVSAARISDHHMHGEHFALGEETVDAIRRARRTFAIGTTVVRVLESCGAGRGKEGLRPGRGETDIFIYPPYRFEVVDALLTNFHLPKSTLLMLVSAFAGRELILEAYARAVEERYRFFSYGDCMVIK